MATEPHPAGHPRAHHPDSASQADGRVRILCDGYVREVRAARTPREPCVDVLCVLKGMYPPGPNVAPSCAHRRLINGTLV